MGSDASGIIRSIWLARRGYWKMIGKIRVRKDAQVNSIDGDSCDEDRLFLWSAFVVFDLELAGETEPAFFSDEIRIRKQFGV